MTNDQNRGARRGEAVLVIEQNNRYKTILIAEANALSEALLGESQPGGLVGQPIANVLGDGVLQSITEDVEFAEGATDFGDVFSRFRDVKLRRKNGEEVAVLCRLSRLMSQGKSAMFQLLILNEYERTSQQKLQEFIRMNLDGRKELDPATGLPDFQTAKSFLPLLKSYFADGQANVVFAVICLDRFDKSLKRYGTYECAQLLLQVHQCCRTSFRSEDLIFALSDRMLGVVLFGISRESARVVFNRLRWFIRSYGFAFGGKSDFSISISISFDMLNLESPLTALEDCMEAIDSPEVEERNNLIELHAS